MRDRRIVEGVASLILGIIRRRSDVEEVASVVKNLAAVKHSGRNAHDRAESIRGTLRVTEKKLHLALIRRTLWAVIEQHRLNQADRAIPPIRLAVMKVPGLYGVQRHFAVAPLRKTISKERIGLPHHLPEKAAFVRKSPQRFELDTRNHNIRGIRLTYSPNHLLSRQRV